MTAYIRSTQIIELMLSVISSPPKVAITGNPIRFTLESDNYLESSGVKAISTMHFSDTGQAGDQFDLTWNNKTITIVCSGSPDNSGNQIPDRTLFAILADWTSAIATALSLNYYLSKNFIIISNAGEVIFTAREFGPELNLFWNTTWNNPQPYLSVISGVVQTTHLFFKAGILVDLFIGSNYQTIAEEVLPVDLSGQVRFDIHKMFSDRLFSEFTFPESSDNLIVLRENSCRGCRIRAYKLYGEDLTARKMIQSDQFHVLNAGISHLQEAIYNRQGSSFWEKLTYNDYFLFLNSLAASAGSILEIFPGWHGDEFSASATFYHYLGEYYISGATPTKLYIRAKSPDGAGSIIVQICAESDSNENAGSDSLTLVEEYSLFEIDLNTAVFGEPLMIQYKSNQNFQVKEIIIL